MYPLVVILGSALWNDESRFYRAALPLSTIGLLIAAYHNLLYYGIIPDSITPCSQGVSCTSKQVEIFGFLTIPLMSLISFMLLTSLGFIAMKTTRRINEK